MVHDFGMLQKQRVPHFYWNANQIVIKTEAHTRKTDPEYQGNALADFHATLARTKIITICNLNELHKIDANQITYNLYKRQNQAPKLE